MIRLFSAALIAILMISCGGSPSGYPERDLIDQGVPESDIKFTKDLSYSPVTVDRDLLRPLSNKLHGQNLINLLYMGRIIPYKGLLELLHAYNSLSRLFPQKFHLHIVFSI